MKNCLGPRKAQKAGAFLHLLPRLLFFFFSPKLLCRLQESGLSLSLWETIESQTVSDAARELFPHPHPHPSSSVFRDEIISFGANYRRRTLGMCKETSSTNRLYPAGMSRNRRLDVRFQVQPQGVRRPSIPKPQLGSVKLGCWASG